MNKIFAGFLVFFIVALFPGCVVSHYKNSKGQDCTRRYFTPLGFPFYSCHGAAEPVATGEEVGGEEIEIAPAAPEPSLRKTTPAQTIAQNIKTTTQFK